MKLQNFLPLFWNTIQNIFLKFHEMSHDKFIWSYSILCIYSSYRDVNYSRVAISKRTKSNLTKRISVQGYRLRANSHCITFKFERIIVLSSKYYIYHPQKKKKKEYPLLNFRISIFENILQSLLRIFIIENCFPLFLRNDPISRIH